MGARKECSPAAPAWADGAVLDQCRCRAAVTRAYAGMRAGGVPDSVALDAALRVYRYHHPEQPVGAALDLVETWVFDGPVH